MHAYHPWYPVLLIGTDKAALYTRALVADIVDKGSHLTDPAGCCASGSTSSCSRASGSSRPSGTRSVTC